MTLAEISCLTDRSELLARLERGGHVIIAGGTDFVPMYVAGAISASHALDLNAIPELQRIDVRDDKAAIGSAVRLVDVANLSAPYLGAVVDGAGLVGSAQTRARATIGGNICRASPSGDTLPGLLAGEADLVLGSSAGERRIRAEEFFIGPGSTARRADEILDRIEIPSRGAVSAYVRATVRNAMDLATVGIALSLEIVDNEVRSGRVAVGGAGPRPLLITGADEVLAGTKLSEVVSRIDSLDALIQQQISPIDDARGSAWYRRELVKPLLGSVIDRLRQRHSSSEGTR